MNAFTDLVGAVKSALEAAPPVAACIDRNRLRIQPQDVDLAAVVRLNTSMPAIAAVMNAPIDWTTRISVECYARADSDADADQAVAPLMNAVFARLDQTGSLQGIDVYLEPGPIEWDFAATGENLVCATLSFTALQRTAAHTLESQP